MVLAKENILYAPVSNYFIGQGFFVFSGSQKPDVMGTSEFSIEVGGQYETVDILAVKWTETGSIRSIAVECKLYETARQGAGAGIRQATDYQLFFDEVYIATQAGKLEDKESVLKILGIGHISVNPENNKAKITLPAQFQHADRYNANLNANQVAPRVAMPLVFRDMFGMPIRYMDAHRGGLWLAKDVVRRVQYNAGGHCNSRKTYFAVNIEFINDLRQIVSKVDRSELRSCFKALGKKQQLN